MPTVNLIQVKRSTSNANPGASLANGEFAYTANGDVLFIGSNATTVAIGGLRVPGTLTANQALVANSTSYLDVVKTANLFINAFTVNTINAVSNSTVLGAAGNNELTTTWAIKNYVDSKAAGGTAAAGANTQVQFNDSAALGGSAGMTFDKASNNFTIANTILVGANVKFNTSTLFVGNSTVNTNIIQNLIQVVNSTSTANLDPNMLKIGSTLVNSTAGFFATSANVGGNVSFSTTGAFVGNSTVNATTTQNLLTIANSTSTANLDPNMLKIGSTLVNSTAGFFTTSANVGANVSMSTTSMFVGNSTVNATTTQNLLTIANSTSTANLDPNMLKIGSTLVNSTAGFFTTSANVGANVSLSTTQFFVGNSTVNSFHTQSLVSVVNSTSTANLSPQGLIVGSTVLNSSSLAVTTITATDATLSGNLTINGTLTTVDATNLVVKDSIIKLADQQTTADALSIGFYGTYGNSTVTQYSGIFRDQGAAGLWKIFNTQKEPTTTVDTANNTYTIQQLNAYLTTGAFVANSTVVNITANSTVSSAIVANSITLTTALAGTSGGTGRTSWTNQDLLVANSTNGITALALGAAGAVYQSNGTALIVATLDGGTF